MRIIAALLLSALIVGSLAVTDEEAYQTLQRMEESKFGRTLLDTIALQMSTTDQVEDLIKLLQEMEHRLNDEQKEDDEFIVKFQHECDEVLAKLEYEIEETVTRIKAIVGELSEKIPVRDQKTKERKDKQEFANMLAETIAEMDRRKVLKDEEWTEIQAEHDSNTFIIEKAKQVLISALQAGFLQKDQKTVLVQVTEHFKQASKLKQKRQSWTGLFNVLASITAAAPVQANQGLVKEVVDLCDELLNKIAESKEVERRSYQHWVEEYNRARQEYTDKLNKINGEIFNLDTELAALNKRINNLQTEKAEQEERQKQKKIQHADHLKQCEDENKSYSVRRTERGANKSVISDAIGLFQQNLRLFRKYVQDRLKNVKKSK